MLSLVPVRFTALFVPEVVDEREDEIIVQAKNLSHRLTRQVFFACEGLCVFHYDAANHVGDFFRVVKGVFHVFENVFPLD